VATHRFESGNVGYASSLSLFISRAEHCRVHQYPPFEVEPDHETSAGKPRYQTVNDRPRPCASPVRRAIHAPEFDMLEAYPTLPLSNRFVATSSLTQTGSLCSVARREIRSVDCDVFGSRTPSLSSPADTPTRRSPQFPLLPFAFLLLTFPDRRSHARLNRLP
jgi:hypothetical protein